MDSGSRSVLEYHCDVNLPPGVTVVSARTDVVLSHFLGNLRGRSSLSQIYVYLLRCVIHWDKVASFCTLGTRTGIKLGSRTTSTSPNPRVKPRSCRNSWNLVRTGRNTESQEQKERPIFLDGPGTFPFTIFKSRYLVDTVDFVLKLAVKRSI